VLKFGFQGFPGEALGAIVSERANAPLTRWGENLGAPRVRFCSLIFPRRI
jgi:hypothetical protein